MSVMIKNIDLKSLENVRCSFYEDGFSQGMYKVDNLKYFYSPLSFVVCGINKRTYMRHIRDYSIGTIACWMKLEEHSFSSAYVKRKKDLAEIVMNFCR